MGARIKPGSLCVIVNSPSDIAHLANGQIVEAVRPSSKHPGCWIIDAAWIRALLKRIGRPLAEIDVEESRLRPIDDPDGTEKSLGSMVCMP